MEEEEYPEVGETARMEEEEHPEVREAESDPEPAAVDDYFAKLAAALTTPTHGAPQSLRDNSFGKSITTFSKWFCVCFILKLVTLEPFQIERLRTAGFQIGSIPFRFGLN